MTHIYVSQHGIIGSDNGMLPFPRQGTAWSDYDLSLVELSK